MKNYRIALALSLVFALFVPSVWAKENNSVNVLENSIINNAENILEIRSEDNDDMQAQIVVSETTDQSLDKDAPPIVWFVHGVKFLIPTQYKSERRTLLIIYPDAEDADSSGVTLKKWDSPMLLSKRSWKRAVQVADDYSQELANEIIALPKEKQKRLILAGHSLGGRIAVRTAAKLMEYNADKSDNDKVFIKKIILAGAAIDNDDKDIASTWLVSNETVVNLINTQDIALAFYCWIGEKHAALGTGYKSEYPKGEYKDKFHEIPVHKSLSHDKYFKVYKMLSNTFYDEIVAPQVRPNLNWNTMNKHMWWDIVDECHGWELQKNLATSRYRIVDDNNVRRAWGHLADAKEVIEVFEIIKGRLIENKGKPEMPNNWWMLINPKQDEFTIYTQKNEDSNAWKTLEQYEGWKFQITKKSEGKAQTNIDAQKADNYRVKRETFENAKNEYFAKIYEYKFFKKRWSRILDKAYYARLEDKFDERLEKDLEEELANAYDEKMDSKQKEEVINEFKKELDANLNSEVDEELSRDWEKEFNDRIDQLKNGLDKKQYKELLKQSDAEFDKEVEKLTKVFDDEKKQLDIQLRIGAYDKKQYNEEYEYLKEDYKEKKYQLKKVYNDKVEQLNNQLYKKLYKELYNDLKEEYKTQKKQLEKDIEGLKKDYKEKEKEYEEVKKYDRTECRILDPENRRRAKGNQTNLKESFEHVKKQIDNLFTRYNN